MTDGLQARAELGRWIVSEAMEAAGRAFRTAAGAGKIKAPGDLVTEADLAIEAMLSARIDAAFPGDAVAGEETGGALRARGFGWLIDPIDGTVNFARGIGYFCVSLTLVRDGQAVGAWIGDPLSGEIFHASAAGELRVNENPVPSRPSQAAGAPRLVGIGFSPRHSPGLDAAVVAALGDTGVEFRRLGAGALSLAHVAAGRLDAYLEPHMNPWDTAGGLYLAAASGAVTLAYPPLTPDCRGGPVFAADPALADALLAVLPVPFAGLAPAVGPAPAPSHDPTTPTQRRETQ